MIYEQSGSTTVIGVSTTTEQSRMVQHVMSEVSKDRPADQEVFRLRNRIKLYRTNMGHYTLLHMWVVVVIRIITNLNSLEDFNGEVIYHLDNVIQRLRNLITQLENLSGKRIMNGESDESKYKKLADSLC